MFLVNQGISVLQDEICQVVVESWDVWLELDYRKSKVGVSARYLFALL